MPSSKSILGIDLRVTSVKVVEIEKGAFKNWGMTEVPHQLIDKHPQLEDAKADALRKIIQTNQIKSREAVAVVGGADTFVKVFTLSELPRGEIAEAIKWKFAEETPFPAEESLFDFYALPKSAAPTEKVDYAAACISRRLFLEVQYITRRAGLRLVGITVLPEALQELYREEITKTEQKIISIIYLGKRTTNISIFRNGNFDFNRELSIGGENITLAMSGILVSPEGKVEVTPEQAEKIKTEHGVPINLETYPSLGNIPLTQLQAMVRPALEKIQTEISRTFEYYKGQTGEAAINRVILTGGSSLTPNLKEFLGEALGIPVVTPEVVPKLHPRLSAALGAARTDLRRLNLVPEEIKHRWKILGQKLTRPQVLLPSCIGLLALIYFSFWLQAAVLRNELANIQKKLEAHKPRLARLEAIQQASQEEEKIKLAFRSYEEKSTRLPLILEELSRFIPESAFLTRLNLSPNEIHLFGTIFKKGDAAENILSRYVLALSRSPVFDDVQLVQATKNYDYTIEAFNFEIVAKVKER
jgi:type IV pilus assembly protein PilM